MDKLYNGFSSIFCKSDPIKNFVVIALPSSFCQVLLLLFAGVGEAEIHDFLAIFPANFRQPEVGESLPVLALHCLQPFCCLPAHCPFQPGPLPNLQPGWLAATCLHPVSSFGAAAACPNSPILQIYLFCLATMAKLKKSKQAAPAPASQTRPSTAPVSGKGTTVAGQPVNTKTTTTSRPSVGSIPAGQPNTAPGSIVAAAKPTTQVGPSNFHQFISDMETPPPTAKHVHFVHAPTNQTGTTGLNKKAVPNAAGLPNTSFAGLFSSNRKLSSKNKLTKFVIEEGPLTLQSNDLVDVHAKLGHCLVGYIAGKFSGLKAIRTLAQSWGASFHQHDSGWLVFRFARDEDRQRILAGGPYFVYGRPLLLKNMPDCFEFKDDDISVTPVWAIFPSLPLECWHQNALGKIGSRLGTPIAMDSLTMSMERVSYARILVKVDASKELVDQVEFVLPNGVTRKHPVVYEFTPKFCLECHRFGHLKDSCKGSLPPATAAATNPTTTVQSVVPKKVQDSDWTLVKRRNRFPKHAQWQKQQQQQHQQPSVADSKMQAQPGPSGQEQISAGQGPVEQARRTVTEEHSPVGSSSSSSDSGSPSTSECIARLHSNRN
ncbi:hypothetical protein Salat_2503100 [Sesamum alatum]|uniref:DUF4283 domain-containing protein n=1 Tax=Sesamum alatum TaxID=300844 RepID=A0AAE1XSH5_9LAMI|nr:hypothetical protein Salat_2503100 [Sesamum alatum]